LVPEFAMPSTPFTPSTPDRPALLLDVRSGPDGAVIVAADGEIDLETSPDLARALQGALDGRARVVVDLQAVSFMDSTGVSLLLTTAEQARRAEAELVIEPSPMVLRVLRLTGVDQVLPLAGA
jgi:anti-sigma B factor antagonist